MRNFFLTSLVVLLSVGTVQTQLQALLPNLLPAIIGNDQLTANLLNSPETIASLIGLFDFFNTTGNATGALGALIGDPQYGDLTTSIFTVLFESLSFATMSQNKVTDACQKDVIIFGEELLKGTGWALSMIDAFGKPGTNLANGQTKFVGSYEECNGLDATAYQTGVDGEVTVRGSFTAKYCSTTFVQAGTPNRSIEALQNLGAGYLQLGLCLPKTCTNPDVEILFSIVERAVFNSTVPFKPTVWCRDGRKDFESDMVVAVIVLVILGCLVVFGTLYDIVVVQMRPKRGIEPGSAFVKSDSLVVTSGVYKIGDPTDEKPGFSESGLNGKLEAHVNVEDNEIENGNPAVAEKSIEMIKGLEDSNEGNKRGPLEKGFLAFSAYTNGAKILNTEQTGPLGALHGIRFFTMCWIILSHTYLYARKYDVNFFQHVREKMHDWTFMVAVYADVAADSFFVMSGLLVAYLGLQKLKDVGGPKKLNWFKYYFHRIWRITPAYMLVLMVGTVVLPYTLRGPFWSYEDMPYMAPCRKNWWTNLLYINNYVYTNVNDRCMEWSWYLACDMQFYLISPLILLPLFFNVAAGLTVCFVLMLGSMVAVGIITNDHRYTAQLVLSQDYLNEPPTDGDIFENIYFPSYARIGPYIIGILTGYILYRWKCKCKIPRALNIIGWLSAVSITAALIFGRYTNEGEHVFTKVESDVFLALERPAMGIAVSWMIFSCVTGHGGWINDLLSWRPFVALGRMSFCAYLIHPLVMLAFYSARMVPTYFTDYEVAYLFLSHLVMTFGLSFVVSLFFETPLMSLEKAILGKKKTEKM